MESLSEKLELLLNRTILFKYKFGFTGEVYISCDEFDYDYKQYKHILGKYFSLKEPFYCNKSRNYYSTDLNETIDLISSIISDTNIILHSEISYKNKQFIIFSLTEYMLSSIGKILGICFSHTKLKNEYYKDLKAYLSKLTDYLVSIIFNEDFKKFPSISNDLIQRIVNDLKKYDIREVREYSEMDNILIMFITYFVYRDYLKEQDIIISPLQGAVLIPPFYISMEKYTDNQFEEADTKKYEYVRFSKYDNSHCCEASLAEQLQILKKQYNKDVKIILIDDNTGTAATIKAIKEELLKSFSNITTGVLECRWDTKLYNPDYPAFQLRDIDLITPLCYRHYRIFDEQIAYIKNDNELHSRYKDGEFYKLNMIYHEIDYYAYINENCTDSIIKKRLLNIYNNFKHIEEIIS